MPSLKSLYERFFQKKKSKELVNIDAEDADQFQNIVSDLNFETAGDDAAQDSASLRIKNQPLLEESDKRYIGEMVSRDQVNEFDSEISFDNEGQSELSDHDSKYSFTSDLDMAEINSDMSMSEAEKVKIFESTKSDRNRGLYVKNSLNTFDSLMKLRMQFNKVLYNFSSKVDSISSENYKVLYFILADLCAAEDSIFKRFSKGALLPALPKKRCIENDSEIGEILSKRRKVIMNAQGSVLNTWSEKIRISTGHAFNESFANSEKDVVSHIESILSDRQRLIKRTQVKRIESQEGLSDAQTYNEDDFYQQLLRDVIDQKTSVADSNRVIASGKQRLNINKLKASLQSSSQIVRKDRAIRYNVQQKIVGFLAPSDVYVWTDDQKDELFKSLFGKIS